MTQAIHPVPGTHHHSSENTTQKLLGWAKTHQEIVFVGGILILLLVIGIPYVLQSREQSEKDAQNGLNLAQYYLQAQVDPKNGPFKSDSDKYKQALDSFHRITTDFAGTKSAKVAQFFEAKCQLFMGQYPQSYASFDVATQSLKGTPLGDEAYLGKVLCLEAQSQWPQAITLLETFLKDQPQNFLNPEIHLRLAEAYLKNQNKDKALDELKLTAKEYSDSNWGKQAAQQLAEIKS